LSVRRSRGRSDKPDEQNIHPVKFPRDLRSEQLPGASGLIANGKKRQKRPEGPPISFAAPLQVCRVDKTPARPHCRIREPQGGPPMSMLSSAIQRSTLGLHSLEQYEPLIGAAAIERIAAKADRVRTMRVAHISSTFYGGGVTELLTPLTLMMNATGIETDWHLIQGTPGYFGCTKKLHNTLQGESLDFSEAEKAIYEQVVFENATRLHLDDCDAIIVHDPSLCR
jgi:hypothetical protein